MTATAILRAELSWSRAILSSQTIRCPNEVRFQMTPSASQSNHRRPDGVEWHPAHQITPACTISLPANRAVASEAKFGGALHAVCLDLRSGALFFAEMGVSDGRP